MSHEHTVVDADAHFIINPDSRKITTSSDKLELIQGDHQSERITFEITRLVEGHDMSLCDRIEIHYINIGKKTKEISKDIYIADDVVVDGNDVTFSWLISGNATKYYGRLNFIVLFKCLDADDNYTYKWNTEICKLLTVGEGISNTAAIVEDYSDILEKFKEEVLSEVFDDIMPSVTASDNGKILRVVSGRWAPTEFPNIPAQAIQRIESTDRTNALSIRSIDSGTYVLYGYFKPYDDATSTMAFSSNVLVNILKGATESHVQVFYPYNNAVQYLKITDGAYERKDTYLNNLMAKTDDTIISSSTAGSTKKFKIIVDDTGTISATEVTT